MVCSPGMDRDQFDFNWNAGGSNREQGIGPGAGRSNILISAANLEIARGNTDRAIELYRKAVDLDPVNAQARSFSPLTWRRRSDSQKRVPNFRA